jgi:hypothetical protein
MGGEDDSDDGCHGYEEVGGSDSEPAGAWCGPVRSVLRPDGWVSAAEFELPLNAEVDEEVAPHSAAANSVEDDTCPHGEADRVEVSRRTMVGVRDEENKMSILYGYVVHDGDIVRGEGCLYFPDEDADEDAEDVHDCKTRDDCVCDTRPPPQDDDDGVPLNPLLLQAALRSAHDTYTEIARLLASKFRLPLNAFIEDNIFVGIHVWLQCNERDGGNIEGDAYDLGILAGAQTILNNSSDLHCNQAIEEFIMSQVQLIWDENPVFWKRSVHFSETSHKSAVHPFGLLQQNAKRYTNDICTQANEIMAIRHRPSLSSVDPVRFVRHIFILAHVAMQLMEISGVDTASEHMIGIFPHLRILAVMFPPTEDHDRYGTGVEYTMEVHRRIGDAVLAAEENTPSLYAISVQCLDVRRGV